MLNIKTIVAAIALATVLVPCSASALSFSAATGGSYDQARKQAQSERREFQHTYSRTETLTAYALYIPFLSEMEKTVPYFRKCGLISHPKTLNDFIYSPVSNAGVDVYALEYMEKMQELGASNKMLRQSRAKRYMLCTAAYGLIVAQAFKDLSAGVTAQGAALARETYRVPAGSFYVAVASSLMDAMRSQSPRLKYEYREIKREINNNACVLYSKSLKCGGVFLNFEGSPKLSFAGLDWFNPQAEFAGRNDIIEIGYRKDETSALEQSRERAINYTAKIDAAVASDFINGGL